MISCVLMSNLEPDVMLYWSLLARQSTKARIMQIRILFFLCCNILDWKKAKEREMDYGWKELLFIFISQYLSKYYLACIAQGIRIFAPFTLALPTSADAQVFKRWWETLHDSTLIYSRALSVGNSYSARPN